MSKFMNRPPPPMMSAAPVPNHSMFVEKLLIGLDHAPAAFDLRGQLLGSNGANLNYIRIETGAYPTLRGRGSMFIDPLLGAESQEPLHLYIEHARFDGLQNAKQLARNLIETLQQELIHFQQSNPPVSTAVQYSQQSTQNTTQVMSGSANVSMLAQIPPPMLAVPPPQIQTTPIMQQNISQPQTVPIQLHRSSNMVHIQQPVQNTTNISVQGNLNVPPPSITMGKPQFVSQIQLSQPPPNLQQNQQVATQIVLNQPATAYQYIQTSNPDVQNHPQGQVTIQHIYQPSGIVQQTTQPVSHFTTQQATSVRPSQHYIVQGNQAYQCIIPPPNIIQQQPPPAQSIPGQQNIIFQTTTNPSNQMPLQQLQLQAPSQLVDNNNLTTHINGNDPENGLAINEEKPNLDPNRSPIKTEIKSEPDQHENHENGEPLNQQIMQTHIPINVNVPPPIQLAQTQLMATPPNSTVQHIVGNTLITSSQPQATQTHQIYNQIPVPLQQIQGTSSQAAHHQQIHVSSGQHILVNAPQYQTQTTFQPMTHNVQSFQITTQPRPAPNEIVMVSNQTIMANPMNQSPTTNLQAQPPTGVFNPHTAPPPVMHFQQICQQQQVLQTIDTSQPQIIEHAPNQFQMQQPPIQNMSGNPHQSMQFIQQQPPMPQEQPRLPMKRKRCNDDINQPPKHLMMLPRIGMGSNNGGQQQQQQQQAQQFLSNIQRDVQQMQSTIITSANNIQTSNSLPIFSTSAATMTTTNNQQDEPSAVNFNNNFKSPMDGNEHFYRMPPMSMAQSNSMSNMMMNMPPRGPPRFQGNNNPGNQMHRMNFGPPPMSQMSQGQRPRYINR